MTDYKQLCADLVAWAEKTSAHYYSQPGVLLRARAALAEPEPEGPTDEELSPAAQVVLDAFRTSHTGQGCLAAALRAAALHCKRDTLILLAIADELETL